MSVVSRPSIGRKFWQMYWQGAAGFVHVLMVAGGLSIILGDGLLWILNQLRLSELEWLYYIILVIILPFAGLCISEPRFIAYGSSSNMAKPSERGHWISRVGRTYAKGVLNILLVSLFLLACIGPWYVWGYFFHNDQHPWSFIEMVFVGLVTPILAWYLGDLYHPIYSRWIAEIPPLPIATTASNGP